jgi:hypothetical protein
MHNEAYYKDSYLKERQGLLVGCIGACLTHGNGMLVSSQLGTCGPPYSLGPAPLASRSPQQQ